MFKQYGVRARLFLCLVDVVTELEGAILSTSSGIDYESESLTG